jgi:hypothetical protein
MGGLICSGQDFGGHGGGIEGLQESPPFMATRPNHNVTRKYMHAETLALLTKPLYFPNMKYLK